MSARLLDGRLVSDFLLTKVRREVVRLAKKKIYPKLVIILVGENPSSLSYIRQKMRAAQRTGILCILKKLPPQNTTTAKLIKLIECLNRDKSVHGILVQMPLLEPISAPLVMRSLDPKKDVDGFHAYNLGKMFLSPEFEELTPCTPAGIIKLLEYYKISPAGKKITILGRSNIVGKPLAVMLINRDATVTVCHSKTKNLLFHMRDADMLVAATGKPRMVKASMIKKGAIVIDVGITKVENTLGASEASAKPASARREREASGSAGAELKKLMRPKGATIVGDVDFDSVCKKASWITPVPGGIGPMTVACLMENVLRAAKNAQRP